MFDTLQVDSVLILALAGLLIGAALSDLTNFIIPNWLNILVLTLGVSYQVIFGDILLALGAGAIVFICGFILFTFRLLGGGDVKLLAATAVWAGFAGLPLFLLHTALAGGALSIIWLVSGPIRQGIARCGIDINVEVPKQIPYGVAIAFGGTLMAFRLATSALV